MSENGQNVDFVKKHKNISEINKGYEQRYKWRFNDVMSNVINDVLNGIIKTWQHFR